MKQTALIIDDEEDAVSVLTQLIGHFTPQVDVIGTAYSALEGIRKINQLKPDIVFLDVQMPGVDGLEMIESYHEKRFEVILTSASSSYSLKAIKLGVTDYLLKPIIPEELADAIRKCSAKQKFTNTHEIITLPEQHGYSIVKVADIVHIKGEGNYTTFYHKNGNPILTSKHLKHYEKQLQHPFLIRCHQSHIVNIHEVTNIKKDDGLYLLLSNGNRAEVSRANKDKLLSLFKPDF